jgi:hypothetical protein
MTYREHHKRFCKEVEIKLNDALNEPDSVLRLMKEKEWKDADNDRRALEALMIRDRRSWEEVFTK